MDDPRNHDANKNKKNTKILPAVINIGASTRARSFGMESIVLLGAGLVTAALVSALAFKTRSQRRSSSENRKCRSPSPETENVNAPKHLESMIKTSQDSCADSLSLNLPYSSGEVTSMKEIQTRKFHNLTLDEKHDSVIDTSELVDSGDSVEDSIFSVVDVDQKNTLMCVDSVSEKLDAYEEIVLDYEEEQAVMEANIESSEEDLSSEIMERHDSGEQKNNLLLTDNELEEQVEKKLLVFNEVVTSIEEYEAIEMGIQVKESIPLGDDVAVVEEDEDVPTGHVGEGRQTIFMNAEAAYVNEIKVEDNPQSQFLKGKQEGGHNEIVLEDSEGEFIEEVGNADQIVSELVIVEELIGEGNGSRVQFVEEDKEDGQLVQYDSEQVTRGEEIKEALEDILEIKVHEVALHVQKMHLTDSFNVSVDHQTAVGEDNQPTQLINKEDACEETEEMITEIELVKKDEIPNGHADGGLIDEIGYTDQVVGELVVEEEEAIDAACVHQIEEDGCQMQFVEDEKENDQDIQHDSEQIEAIKAACVDSVNEEDIMEMTNYEANIINHKIQENMEEKQTILSKNQNNSDHNGIIKEDKGSEIASRGFEPAKEEKQVLAREAWNLKLLTCSILISIWFLCHWYFELPFPEVSLAGCFLFILISVCYRNHTKRQYK